MEHRDNQKNKPLRLRDRLNKMDGPKPKKHPAPSNAFLWVEDQQYKLLEVSYGFKRHADGYLVALWEMCIYNPLLQCLSP